MKKKPKEILNEEIQTALNKITTIYNDFANIGIYIDVTTANLKRFFIKGESFDALKFTNLGNAKIDFNKSTSLHCHPKKKSGFILLYGKAQFQLGLREKNTELHTSPSKRMIARGLFHSIKSLSRHGLIVLEFETPVDKNDLVKYISGNYIS